jgi:DNA-binding CsgD family transcriptional regulator
MIVPTPRDAPHNDLHADLAAAEAIVFGFGVPADVGGEADAATMGHGLSPREREVLALASRGLSNADVSRALDLSIETVKSHMRRVLRKLGARNRCHAVALGYETGVLVPRATAEPAPIP